MCANTTVWDARQRNVSDRSQAQNAALHRAVTTAVDLRRKLRDTITAARRVAGEDPGGKEAGAQCVVVTVDEVGQVAVEEVVIKVAARRAVVTTAEVALVDEAATKVAARHVVVTVREADAAGAPREATKVAARHAVVTAEAVDATGIPQVATKVVVVIAVQAEVVLAVEVAVINKVVINNRRNSKELVDMAASKVADTGVADIINKAADMDVSNSNRKATVKIKATTTTKATARVKETTEHRVNNRAAKAMARVSNRGMPMAASNKVVTAVSNKVVTAVNKVVMVANSKVADMETSKVVDMEASKAADTIRAHLIMYITICHVTYKYLLPPVVTPYA